MVARIDESVLVVVDMQATFLRPIFGRDEVVRRCQFLIECANLLDVPVIATEQVPEKMGGTEPAIRALLQDDPVAKQSFGCFGEKEFRKAWKRLDRPTAVLCGIETHICLLQTANQLLDEDHDVVICADAASAREQSMHKLALKRLRDEGVAMAHSETVVYEWMESAEHPKFREVLEVVKRYTPA
ncbi:MAG: isochorismatase family protein [Fimbriimonadaceae bacterium]|nr:isochorismatase family protein [Fimbriimonadaceae bacterium]QYK56307.1 MAG: isochorismatase family protein [Fimbriimonadaceae bacterium]